MKPAAPPLSDEVEELVNNPALVLPLDGELMLRSTWEFAVPNPGNVAVVFSGFTQFKFTFGGDVAGCDNSPSAASFEDISDFTCGGCSVLLAVFSVFIGEFSNFLWAPESATCAAIGDTMLLSRFATATGDLPSSVGGL